MFGSKARQGALALVFALFFAVIGASIAFAAQSHMQAALTNLQSASSELQQAQADKAGHREKAINLVNQAIDEVKAGIAAGKPN